MVGALRSPARPSIPIETGFPSVNARAGSWQVAHATVPSADNRPSKKSFSPRAIFSGVCRLSGGTTARVRSGGAPTCRGGLGSASGPGVGIAGWAAAVGGAFAAELVIMSSVTISRTRRRTRISPAQPPQPRLSAATPGRGGWLGRWSASGAGTRRGWPHTAPGPARPPPQCRSRPVETPQLPIRGPPRASSPGRAGGRAHTISRDVSLGSSFSASIDQCDGVATGIRPSLALRREYRGARPGPLWVDRRADGCTRPGIPARMRKATVLRGCRVRRHLHASPGPGAAAARQAACRPSPAASGCRIPAKKRRGCIAHPKAALIRPRSGGAWTRSRRSRVSRREVGPQQRSLTERRHPAMVRNNLGGRVTLLGLGVLGLVGSALVSVPARVQADSPRDLGSVTTSASFCADLDRVVALAPSGFRSLRAEAESANIVTQVTEKLPGASQCWYDNSLRSYWCSWNVAAAERSARVQQLVSAVASCYQVQPEYDDDYDRETIAFGALPGSTSIYINGVGDSVSIFIGGDDHKASAP